MELFVINSEIIDQFIKALCNTLVHSLWQGLLLSALAGLIIIFTKRASSALRYNLLITALVLFVVGVSITFAMQFKQFQNTTIGTTAKIAEATSAVGAVVGHTYKPVEATGFTTQLFGYLNSHHNTIVLLWFLIICAKSIHLGIGLLGTYRLKRTNVFAVSDYWNDKMQQLASQLNIKQTISLLESGLAKVPMVIGHLKPVILIPIGLLTALSTEEVEAILVHELAHIKRRDYLINLLQCLMEIVFFFNPAVLWVSQLIKAERENCCDDIAIYQSSNKVNYIRALVSCEEYQSAVPAYAMGFPGGKSSLFDRVKRMADNSNHSLNLFEKTALAICLVVSGLCLSAFAEKDDIKQAIHKVVTVMTPKKSIKESKQIAIKTEIKETNTHTEIIADTGKHPIAPSAKLGSMQPANLLPLSPKLSPLSPKLSPLSPKLSPLAESAYRDSVARYKTPAYAAKPYPADYNKKQPAYKPYDPTEDNARRDAAIGEMIKDGLIKTKDNLSFKISSTEFILNDVKQPDNIYQKYRAKYVKNVTNGEWSWMYNYDTEKHKETNHIVEKRPD